MVYFSVVFILCEVMYDLNRDEKVMLYCYQCWFVNLCVINGIMLFSFMEIVNVSLFSGYNVLYYEYLCILYDFRIFSFMKVLVGMMIGV